MKKVELSIDDMQRLANGDELKVKPKGSDEEIILQIDALEFGCYVSSNMGNFNPKQMGKIITKEMRA